MTSGANGLRIAFIHPDLGLGGAERLVVDAATELAQAGHHVDMYTAYYDPNRCFEETKTGGFAVITAGSWFPRHVLGRMLALCAYVRCVLIALYVSWRCFISGSKASYDVIIADQVAVVVPVVKLLMPRTRLLFYCHFPDLLLATRESALKKLYRAPLDYLEEVSTGAADLILVNSKYTRGVFAQTFRRLAARGIQPGVLYPAVPIPSEADLRSADAAWRSELDSQLVSFMDGGTTFLSINRFERKKGSQLALEALHELWVKQGLFPAAPEPGGTGPAAAGVNPNVAAVPSHRSEGTDGGGSDDGDGGGSDRPRLLVAGGYDPRLPENVEYLEELREAARQLGIQDSVRFMPSFTDRQRMLLLAACRAVLYTPQHEHFGIVPLEAMAAGRPVVACNNGGPTESVTHGSAGFLCEPTPAAFAAAMDDLTNAETAEAMGRLARAHVEGCFSRRAFGEKLDGYVRELAAARANGGKGGDSKLT